MIESWRYQRALRANALDREPPYQNLQVYLDQEHITQSALAKLGVGVEGLPKEIPEIDKVVLIPELIKNRSAPFIVEVMGMPQAGKSSSINHFLEQTWLTDQRGKIRLVQEGARTIPDEYQDFKDEDPFTFHLMAGNVTFTGLLGQVRDVGQFSVLLQDRGMLDRRVFRRALFFRGKVHPGWMAEEAFWADGLETPMFPIGGLVMCLVTPETSLAREGPREKPGSVMNADFLKTLYEQYLRFHYEILSEQLLMPSYACLDMECEPEDRFRKFNNAIGQILSA